MRKRETAALAGACRWLAALPIAADDSEHQILRLFGLAVARASRTRLRACARELAQFVWFRFAGDPLAAVTAHRALAAAGVQHAALIELETGYRSALKDSGEATPLMCDLLGLPVATKPELALPPASGLVAAGREQVLELCRLVTMTTSAGLRQVAIGGAADLLPALAFSYARDWDLPVSCALLRSSAYLGLSDRPECRWTAQWILDQQNEDGSFGLLRAEAARCGHDIDDWRSYVERTVHAMWALADCTREAGLRRLLGQAATGRR